MKSDFCNERSLKISNMKQYGKVRIKTRVFAASLLIFINRVEIRADDDPAEVLSICDKGLVKEGGDGL